MITPAQRDKEYGNIKSHTPYTDQDPGRPLSICDSMGRVTLLLCKRCNAGESELYDYSCDEYIAWLCGPGDQA